MQLTNSKSGILSWSEENIKISPETPGFFVLRVSPVNGDFLHANSTENLLRELSKIYIDNAYADVKFFEWFSSENENDAKKAFEQWLRESSDNS